MRSRTAFGILAGVFGVLLVFAIPVALTGGSEDRRTALGLVLAAGVVGGLWWLDRTFRREPRRRAAEDAGVRLGLRPSSDDAWIRALRFDLLRPRGTLQDVSNLLVGTWRGGPAATFEYRWANEDTERRYSCAVLSVPASWPRLVVARESALTRVARDAGLGDVETEWEEFNRAFRIASEDARFATAVLDGGMMEWLVGRPPTDGFEMAAGRLLAYTSQVHPWEIEQVLEAGLAFRGRIPAVVDSLFGDGTPPRPDGASPRS